VSDETAISVALVALGVAALSLLVAIWLLIRTHRLTQLAAFRPEAPASLQDAVERDAQRVDQLSRRVDDVAAGLTPVEARSSLALQRVGVVRFNPFEDTGGQQSFALTVLDARGSGVVVSSLHSRQATRVYLKHVGDGHSDAALSHDEAEAIRRALAAAMI